MAAALEATASAGAGFDSLAAQTQRGLADRGDLTGRLLLDLDLSRRSTAELDAAISATQTGAVVLKFGRSGRPQKRFVRVSAAGDAIAWASKRKKAADCTVLLSDVDRIQRGQHTAVFSRHAREYRHLADVSLSIVRPGGARTLDLVFESPQQLETWYLALTSLLLRLRAAHEDSDVKHLWRAFVAEEERCGAHGALGYTAIKAILRRLNIYRNKRELLRLMSIVAAEDGGGSGEPLLTFQRFMRLVDLTRDRPDVATVFDALMAARPKEQ